jgi:hypothetical protein
MAQPPDPNEPFWGHWVRRGGDGDNAPPPRAEAAPRQRWAWLSSRWFGGCLAAGAALGLGLGIWARLAPGPAHFVPVVNTVTPPASTVTSTVTRPVTHVVTQPAPAPPPVTEWATPAAPPPATVTATAPRVEVTVGVQTTVTVTAPPSNSP